jgi:hypothetical protein
MVCLLAVTRACPFTDSHKPIEAVHHKEIVQLFIRIYKNDFSVDFSHPFEKAYDFPYSGTVNKRNQTEINGHFPDALFRYNGIETALEKRTMFKRNLSLDTNDSAITLRIHFDVHSRSGKNTVIFQQP